MKTVLADIGGTHVRFALADSENGQDELINPVKLKAADFPGFQDAMEHYLRESGEEAKRVMPATAAWPNADGVYIFSNQTGWNFDPEAMREAGYQIDYIYNDFEAASYGALSSSVQSIETLKEGRTGRSYPKLVCGPGTGLGLGFALPEGLREWRVQPTFGANMMVACHTQEQFEIVQAAGKLKEKGDIISFEDMASGRGMILLHAAVCEVNGYENNVERAEHVLASIEEDSSKTTLRLFHEFLGLFLHSATMFTHSFSGVYMCGGMMDRLKERDLLQTDTLVKFMTVPLIEYIDHVMKDTAVYYVSDPWLALRGLQEAHSYGR